MKLQVQLVYLVNENSPHDKHLLQNGHFDFILQALRLQNKWICIRINRNDHKEASYMLGEIYTLHIDRFTNKITLISTGKIEPLFSEVEFSKVKERDTKGQRDTGFILTKNPLKLNQFMTYTKASLKKDYHDR